MGRPASLAAPKHASSTSLANRRQREDLLTRARQADRDKEFRRNIETSVQKYESLNGDSPEHD